MKSIIQNVQISAISSYLPENKLDLLSLSNEYGVKEVANIIRATGIESVRIANTDQTSSDMCFIAAQNLIERENINRNDIDGVVFASQTADYILPSTSVILQDRLVLSKSTVCLDIHYGCSGYIYGIFQAALWIKAGACKNVLVLSGDTSSRIVNSKDRSLRMVFGDCGTATIVKSGSDTMGFSINSDGSGFDKLIIPAGGFRTKCSQETKKLIIDEDNNGRTKEDMYMDGMAIFDFAISNVHNDINSLLNHMNWDKDLVGLYALHQANKFMVNSIRKKMKVDQEKVPLNIKEYGNTGPATIPLLLSDINSIKQYDLNKVILSGFGVGLSWGSIACDLSKTNLYEPINK